MFKNVQKWSKMIKNDQNAWQCDEKNEFLISDLIKIDQNRLKSIKIDQNRSKSIKIDQNRFKNGKKWSKKVKNDQIVW